jgi:hypothetical protein
VNDARSEARPTVAYRPLIRLGGIAAFLVVALTLAEVVAFMIVPQPGTVLAWFALFRRSPLLGLLSFWGLEVPMYLMFVLVFLALYVVLRADAEGGMLIATALVLLGVGVFLATNNPFTMFALSRRYAAATTGAQRAALLAAGEVVVANTAQRAVGGFNTALFLVSVAGLIAAAVMLRSRAFRPFTGYVGLLAHALSLADYVRQALASDELLALLVIMPGALLLVLWFGLVGRRLWQLGGVGPIQSRDDESYCVDRGYRVET